MTGHRAPRHVAVIDIGKTNAKLTLVDVQNLREIASYRIANQPVRDGPYPHADIDGIWQFLRKSLARLNQQMPIDAICTTTHGASAALVGETGELVLSVLDYEHPGPGACDDEYARARPAFSQSMTSPLPGGLNLAKQLYWQAQQFPAEFARAKWILPYPQYWGFLLTGVAASEITSLGCHTDLWNFQTNQFSDIVTSEGWAAKFAPLRKASDVLGPIGPQLAKDLGLRAGIPVHVGIHDSNASLLPHVIARQATPFAVVSTGTWVVVFAPGGDLQNLDPTRDSFANIDMFARRVASARFMGGREFIKLVGDQAQQPDAETIKHVLDAGWMLLPSVSGASGPFPNQIAKMTVARGKVSEAENYTIVSFYLAMMTGECLALTGASGDIIVEGPFVENSVFLQMLTAACGRPVLAQKSNRSGTSLGAALLASDLTDNLAPADLVSVDSQLRSEMAAYALEWRRANLGR